MELAELRTADAAPILGRSRTGSKPAQSTGQVPCSRNDSRTYGEHPSAARIIAKAPYLRVTGLSRFRSSTPRSARENRSRTYRSRSRAGGSDLARIPGEARRCVRSEFFGAREEPRTGRSPTCGFWAWWMRPIRDGCRSRACVSVGVCASRGFRHAPASATTLARARRMASPRSVLRAVSASTMAPHPIMLPATRSARRCP